MAPDGAPRRAGAPPSGLLLIAACCAAALAALPQAAAACQAAEQAASNYQFSFVTESATRACFSLAVAANCSSDAPCCLKSEAKIKKLLLAPNGANPACMSRDNLKQLRVTLNAAQTKSRPAKSSGQQVVSTGIKGALSSDALVCVDASAVPGCGTIKKLCGDTCSFRLTARGPSRGSGKRATCCVNAAVTLPPPPPPIPPTPGKFNLVTINVGADTSLDAYFEAARERWEKIMNVDLPDVDPNEYKGPRFEWWPGYSMPVDDVTIFYQLTEIDGKSGILGQAGPEYIRTDYWETPITGIMEFDIDDLDALTATEWRDVILHEMGHVLGIGVGYYWQEKHECIPRPGSKGMPISRVTIGALEDIYGPGSVNYTQADAWNCNAASTTGTEAPARVEEGEVILLEPLPRGAGGGGREGQRRRATEAARAAAALLAAQESGP
ncbi:hypothetical protein Rsub_02745 [Raphidocelis subcapitata]|uniref:Peptidase metallopeptidase domain-containing protein n=1 Tax=Raphidocelis subcapitata TaxID=307507 RepID=A0A2V0NYN4_9CHLO|nr:hypothetical protein Rsub_02745 [Raphidocelis subcapitata]|eukprot:GBF90037.1 hypothetical protein Rsub_02745 [Raphidocelis subcapitata]